MAKPLKAASSELLYTLDKMLAETVLAVKPRDLAADPEYVEQHKAAHKKVAS